MVRVLPEGSIDKTFDYSVPVGLEGELVVGSLVRVSLSGRRVTGWVVAVDPPTHADIELKPLVKITGRGPSAELIELAGWAAWRWAGRTATFLGTASPPTAVRSLPPPAPRDAVSTPLTDGLIDEALGCDRAVLRLPPGADRYPLVLAAAAAPGNALVICPTVGEARALAARLRRSGLPVACLAHDRPGSAAAGEWARAAAGTTAVGARAAAWAPIGDLGRIVVLDEHDETYQSERSPTWHARDVAVERAKRAAVPCLLASPCPTLEALDWGRLLVPSRSEERRGWPALEVVDRRREDPVSAGLYSERLVSLVRSGARVLCVVNRVGRARLLACVSCGELARCEVCNASVEMAADELTLRCRRCDTERPVVCASCGSVRFKNLRAGVSRVREELEALVGEPVGEVTATTDDLDSQMTRVVVGTTAVLRRVGSADAVAFLDIDQDLTAVRYRANEQALGLIALAARLVRGRRDHGKVLVQTRQPDHLVLQAALHADPGRVSEAEEPLRQALRLPPSVAMAIVSGAGASEFVETLGHPLGVTVEGPADGAWRLRATDHRTLCDSLAGVARPSARLRIEVDPLHV